VAFANALKVNRSLTNLNLSGFVAYESKDVRQKVGDEGAVAIAAALKANSTVKELMLDHHDIGDKGCEALGAAAAESKSLRLLSLEYNIMTDSGSEKLKKSKASRKELRMSWSTEIVPPPPDEIPPPPSESEDIPPPPPIAFRKDGVAYHARRISMVLDGEAAVVVMRDNPLVGDGKEGKSKSPSKQ